jgi:hypothetical protein
MLNDGGRDFTQRDKAAQALVGFEQDKKPYLGNATFGGMMGDQAFLRGRRIDLCKIFGREDLLEARIGGSFNCGHRASHFRTRQHQLDTAMDFCYYTFVEVANARQAQFDRTYFC